MREAEAGGLRLGKGRSFAAERHAKRFSSLKNSTRSSEGPGFGGVSLAPSQSSCGLTTRAGHHGKPSRRAQTGSPMRYF